MPPALAPKLSRRERQILAMFASGEAPRVKVVARELGLSVSTVRNHLCRISQRLGTQSVTQAVVVALRDGLLDGVPLEGPTDARHGDAAGKVGAGVGGDRSGAVQDHQAGTTYPARLRGKRSWEAL
ncbi:MAG: hypothetical protein GEV08_06215 [Acidimicrobiia bacterium]|nr:hypothetical protein [Acidimicrobiia bacterium]